MRRRAARSSLLPFTEYTTPGWEAGRIHREIAGQFDRILRREIDRLILACPPQHGKSTLASKRFPALALGVDPTLDILSVSATAPLAQSFGREVRNCVGTSEYRTLFPATTLAEDSQAKGLWNTDQGGLYFAAGMGGAIMGRGGNLGLIDDPFATWDDAQRGTVRDAAWDWYTGTFYNRIRPGGAIVVIEHRMHEEDLIGRLLEKMRQGKDQWTVVEIPALLENPPWIERYDRAALERLKANTDPRKWSALYMQNPTPDEGTYFKREWLEFYDPRLVPAGHRYTTADYAVTEDGGDSSEVGTHVYAADGTLYLAVDAWHGQTSADTWIEITLDQFARNSPLCFFGEKGVIQRATEPFLKRRMQERRTYCRLEYIARTRDKPAMARPLQAMAASGKVRLPDNDYGHRLQAQMLGFPGGARDDAVDMCGLMALALDQAHPAVSAAYNPPPPRDRWGEAFGTNVIDIDTWKTA